MWNEDVLQNLKVDTARKIGSIIRIVMQCARQEMGLFRKIKHECQVASHYGDQV